MIIIIIVIEEIEEKNPQKIKKISDCIIFINNKSFLYDE